jgi:hypothetical protein
LGISLYPFIGQEMMPLGDSGQFMATVEAEPGLSFAKADQISAQFEQILLQQPEVIKVSAEIGFELTSNSTYFSGYSMGGVNSSSLIVTIKDREERSRDIWQVIDAVEAEARHTIPGIRPGNGHGCHGNLCLPGSDRSLWGGSECTASAGESGLADCPRNSRLHHAPRQFPPDPAGIPVKN